MMRSTTELLDKIYARCAENESAAALDLIYDEMGYFIDVEDYRSYSNLLAALDLDRLDTTAMFGFLSCTFGTDRLNSERKAYLRRIKKHLTISNNQQRRTP